MRVEFDLADVESYRTFLAVKSLPSYRIVGRTAHIPDEYAARLGLTPPPPAGLAYEPIPGLFDYQAAVSALAIRKRKFAVFMRCGLGKSLVSLEFARHARRELGSSRRVLIVTPLMVGEQLIGEAARFYGDSLPIARVAAADLPRWAESEGPEIGVTNYEALTDKVSRGRIGALVADESSTMKSAYGKWGQRLIELGKGLEWKLALTGTPAPNDRIEFANHSVFLDAFPTVNAFLARFFVNRGETANRWELKPHALRPFYRALSDWSIFLDDPATYGWRDNVGAIPTVHVHIHDVDLTDDQQARIRAATGMLVAGANPGGIVGRSKLARIAKGGDSLKPAYIRDDLIGSWPGESTIVWCKFNDEQEHLSGILPGSASIEGKTPYARRVEMLDDFRSGRSRTLISKPEVLGFGLNLQVATRHVFSTLHDSWEDFHQAISRSNRVGSSRPLDVHIPLTDAERPMVETVLRKARRIEADLREQESIFREESYGHLAA